MPTATVTTVTLPDQPAPLAVVRTDDDERWTFQPIYLAGAGAPLGRLQRLTIAARHPDDLLDACLAFFPEVFLALRFTGACAAGGRRGGAPRSQRAVASRLACAAGGGAGTNGGL